MRNVHWTDESHFKIFGSICDEVYRRVGLGGLQKGFNQTRWSHRKDFEVYWKQPCWRSAQNLILREVGCKRICQMDGQGLILQEDNDPKRSTMCQNFKPDNKKHTLREKHYWYNNFH
jgi:hypothetical protein